jgi:hypothetical protein
MEATLKRRTILLAAIHLALTVIVWFVLLDSSGLPKDAELIFRQIAWVAFWFKFFTFLQPQLWFVMKFGGALDSLSIPNWCAVFMSFAVFASVPLWSLCFGWLCAKLDGWLNHFPALGRRVF